MPTQTGRHFSPEAVRLDYKKSRQSSGGIASGLSTILRQKAVITPSELLSADIGANDGL